MSERQARIKRKNEPQQEVTKKRKGSIAGNVIITIIIIAFLGLGYYAIKDKLPKPDPKPVTVETLAEDKGMSVEDFIKEYGLGEDVTKDTSEDEFLSKLTVENYAKYKGQTVEELLEENGIKGEIDPAISWTEAKQYETIGHYLQQQSDENGEAKSLEAFLSESGVPEDLWQFITEDKTLKEAEDFVSKLTVEEYAKYKGQTVSEWLKENGIKEKLDGSTPWTEAAQYETVGHYLQKMNEESGEEKTLEAFLTESGVPEAILKDITEDTTMKAVGEMWQNYEAETAETEDGASAESETQETEGE